MDRAEELLAYHDELEETGDPTFEIVHAAVLAGVSLICLVLGATRLNFLAVALGVVVAPFAFHISRRVLSTRARVRQLRRQVRELEDGTP